MNKLNLIIAVPEKSSEEPSSLEDKIKYAMDCAKAGSDYHSDYLDSIHKKLLERKSRGVELPDEHKRILTLLESHNGK